MSDTKEELKPCPFCGAPAARAIHDEQWVAGCSNEQCRNDALIPFSQWNTRPPIPALKVAREALGACRADCHCGGTLHSLIHNDDCPVQLKWASLALLAKEGV
jgi:hypothetical protein